MYKRRSTYLSKRDDGPVRTGGSLMRKRKGKAPSGGEVLGTFRAGITASLPVSVSVGVVCNV